MKLRLFSNERQFTNDKMMNLVITMNDSECNLSRYVQDNGGYVWYNIWTSTTNTSWLLIGKLPLGPVIASIPFYTNPQNFPILACSRTKQLLSRLPEKEDSRGDHS